MKTPIRSIFVFADEIFIYRKSKCRSYPICSIYSKRRSILLDAIWNSGKVENVFNNFWDTQYKLKEK